MNFLADNLQTALGTTNVEAHGGITQLFLVDKRGEGRIMPVPKGEQINVV